MFLFFVCYVFFGSGVWFVFLGCIFPRVSEECVFLVLLFFWFVDFVFFDIVAYLVEK